MYEKKVNLRIIVAKKGLIVSGEIRNFAGLNSGQTRGVPQSAPHKSMISNHLTQLFNRWAFDGFSALIISMVIAAIILPNIILISYRKRLFRADDNRKIHAGYVPRLGGVAFMPSILIALAIVVGISHLPWPEGLEYGFGQLMTRSELAELAFGIAAMLMIYIVGIADDIAGVSYRVKLAVQAAGAMLIVCSGLRIESLGGFCGVYEIDPMTGNILTIVVVMLIVNAMNFFDGIDGLAAGLTLSALTYYALICFNEKCYGYFTLAMASIGAIVPFFYYNVYGKSKKHNKIFMGDTGSLTLGLLLSVAAIKCSNLSADASMGYASPVALAFSPLVLPCFDLLRVCHARIRSGVSPFKPDRTHLHHKLLAEGLSQGKAATWLVVLSAVVVAINSALCSMGIAPHIVLGIDFALWLIFNHSLNIKLRKRLKADSKAREYYKFHNL